MTDILRTRMARSALLTGGTLVVLGAMLFGALSTVGRLRHDRAILSWNSRYGSWEDLLARYPPRPANETALHLEELVSRLGIDLAPEALPDRRRPTGDEKTSYRLIAGQPGGYLHQQITRPVDVVDAPPRLVGEFLRKHDAELSAIRGALLGGDEPRWELQLESGPQNPLPNLLGHITLQKILLADALSRTHDGDHRTALADLEASWRLNGALREDPVLITQMIGLSIAAMQAGTLRHMEDVGSAWQERLTGQLFRRTAQGALHNEIRFWSAGGVAVFERDAGPLKRGVIAVAVPYVRLCLADVSEQSLRHMESLSRMDSLCAGDSADAESDLSVKFARWNVLAPLILPNLAVVMERIARLELDLELTVKILELKAMRDARGSWPSSLDAADSVACPPNKWIFENLPGGRVSILFSREIAPSDASGVMLPTSFVARDRS